MVRTRFEEGVAFNFGRNGKPFVTLAGTPAVEALGLKPGGKTRTGQKLGVSDAGWIGIGLGAVAIGAGVCYLIVLDEARDNSD